MILNTTASINFQIAKFLRALRMNHGMTVEEIAFIADCEAEKMQEYEAGEKEITAAQFLTITNALRIPVDNLTTGTEIFLEETPVEAEAYTFLKIFSEIEDEKVRKKVLELCLLYEDFQR